MIENAAEQAGELSGLLTQMLLFFAIAGVAIPLLQRLKITPVLGYLLCGVIIGPYGVALLAPEVEWLNYFTVTDTEAVHLLGELGIIAMMFMIGLELSLQRLKELKRFVLGLGSLQIIVTGAIISVIASLFKNENAAALLIGASLALSSTAIVMQLLSEQHLGNRAIGTLCFSILLMQDLAVVPIVVLASAFAGSSDQSLLFILLESLTIAVFAVTGIYMLGRLGLRPLWKMVGFTQNPEWFMAFILFIVVASSATTQYAGLSAALGAFLAGLLIAETECSHAVEVVIAPLKNLLLGIFFLSIGMMIDFREVLNAPMLIIISVAGIFAIKTVVLYPLCRLFKVPPSRSAKAAVMMSQPGEFAFLILSLAMSSQLMPRADAQFFLLVTALSMFIAPLVFRSAPFFAKLMDRELKELGQVDAAPFEDGQVLIAGFGRVGLRLAKILERQKIPYQAIDHNAERVREKRKLGYNVLYSDARHGDLWKRLGIEYSSAAIITVDDSHAAKQILRTIRRECPLLPIIIRASDIEESQDFYATGATHVIPEIEESSRQLAQSLLQEIGIENDKVYEIIQRERQEELPHIVSATA